MTEFEKLLPVTHGHIQRLMQGKPHEIYGKQGGCKARVSCAKALGRAVLTVLATPFSILFRLIVVIQQLGILLFRALLLMRPNPKRIAAAKATGYELADQLILFPLEFVLKLTLVMKMACAILIPRLYFKMPHKCTVNQQIEYYLKANGKIFRKLFDTRDIGWDKRAGLLLLEEKVIELEAALPQPEKKRDLSVQVARHVRSMEQELTLEKLQAFKQFLLDFARAEEIHLEIQSHLA